jgi:hypothetical protein
MPCIAVSRYGERPRCAKKTLHVIDNLYPCAVNWREGDDVCGGTRTRRHRSPFESKIKHRPAFIATVIKGGAAVAAIRAARRVR